MAEIKVCEPVSVPVSVLQEMQELRALLGQLRSEVERLTQENDRLRQENEQLKAELDEARRQNKRQAAPFSKGAPKQKPRKPGRKPGPAHGRHAHRPIPDPAHVDETFD